MVKIRKNLLIIIITCPSCSCTTRHRPHGSRASRTRTACKPHEATPHPTRIRVHSHSHAPRKETHRYPYAHPHLLWPFCASAGCTPRCALTTRRNCMQARATCCDPRCCVRTARRAVAAAHWPPNAQLTVGRTGRKFVVVTTRLWRDFKSTAGACSFPTISFFLFCPNFPATIESTLAPPLSPAYAHCSLPYRRKA